MQTEVLLIVIAKALAELAGLFLLGRGLLSGWRHDGGRVRGLQRVRRPKRLTRGRTSGRLEVTRCSWALVSAPREN